MAFVSFYVILLPSLFALDVSAEGNNEQRSSCAPFFNCGKLGKISFPFTLSTHLGCGLIVVSGCNDTVQTIQLEKGGSWYQLESISDSKTIQINDTEFQNSLQSHQCSTFRNLSFPSSPHVSFQITPNLTLLKCCHTLKNTPRSKYNYTGCNSYNIFYGVQEDSLPSLPSLCSILQLPVNRTERREDIFKVLTGSYTLEIHVSSACYKCSYHHGGQCQLDGEGRFHCANATVAKKVPLVAKAVTGAIGIALFIFVIYCIWLIMKSIFLSKKEKQSHQNIKSILSNYGMIKMYSYSEVRNMTKSFRDKLGEGGYGSVYKGNLPDGRLVAVKVLNESKTKTNGEDFINEVAIISRTSHINIVTLLGFCFEGRKRALIYEFMSNGSLEKFIYEENSLLADCQLRWQKLYQIAVGTARGLEYLHRGCNMRILHFDIKPHNILLDDEFCPKISDFGLAKICPRKESIISILSPRGTAGYIAPEVFCRSFGRVSHKSDVYSYGRLVLEMVGGRRKIDVGVDNTSETYFPHLVYRKIELDEDLDLQGIMNEKDKESVRKMIIVGLWCIQTDPSNRPPMSTVVEMLEGSLECLKIPPKPFLSSPTRSEMSSSTVAESWIFSEKLADQTSFKSSQSSQ